MKDRQKLLLNGTADCLHYAKEKGRIIKFLSSVRKLKNAEIKNLRTADRNYLNYDILEIRQNNDYTERR